MTLSDVSLDLDAALGRRYETYTTPILGGGFTIHDPLSQQRDSARGAIDDLRRRCSAWQAERFPGLFATLEPAEPLPSWLFMTTEIARPFSEERVWYLDSAGLSQDLFAWAAPDELPSLRFGPPSRLGPTESITLLAGRRTEVLESLARDGVSRDPEGLSYVLHAALRSTFVASAFPLVLSLYSRTLAEIRDSLALEKSLRVRKGVNRLKEAHNALGQIALDAQLAAIDAKRLAHHTWRGLTQDVPLARPIRPELWLDANLTFPQLLTMQTEERSAQLAEEEEGLRALMVAMSSIVSAIVNIRLQRMIWWFSAALGATAIGVTIWAALK
jgi:hypothetical protein